MNVLGISSNTYNILATLFKHIFYENEFAPRAPHTHQGGLNNTVILSRAETSRGGGYGGCDTPLPNIVIL